MRSRKRKNSLPIAAVKEDMFSSVQICSVLNVQKTLVFDYGYTIKLLTNFFAIQKIFGPLFSCGPFIVRSVLQNCGPNIFLDGIHNCLLIQDIGGSAKTDDLTSSAR